MGTANMSNLIYTKKHGLSSQHALFCLLNPNREVMAMHKLKCIVLCTPTTTTAHWMFWVPDMVKKYSWVCDFLLHLIQWNEPQYLTGAGEVVFPWQPKAIDITWLLFSLCKTSSLNSLSAWVYLIAPWIIPIHKPLYLVSHAGNTKVYSHYLMKLNS